MIDQVAAQALHASNHHHHHSHHQFQQQQQQQHQQHRYRHSPYNIQQRLHNSDTSGSPPGIQAVMKDEPDSMYTPNYWSHPSPLTSNNSFLDSSAFDAVWNSCNGSTAGSYFAPPVTSSPPSKYKHFDFKICIFTLDLHI